MSIVRPEVSSSRGRMEAVQANLPGEHLPEQHFKKKYFNQVGRGWSNPSTKGVICTENLD
jgi:hypothetical protein